MHYDVTGCTDPSSVNYLRVATLDDGSCRARHPGCLSPLAANYDSDANIDMPASCVFPDAGCTVESALNFEPDATRDDGSCLFGRAGCDDSRALKCAAALPAAQKANPCPAAATSPHRVLPVLCLPRVLAAFLPPLSPARLLSAAGAASTPPPSPSLGRSLLSYSTSAHLHRSFDPNATVARGCVFAGCADSRALNADAEADVDDGSCVYAHASCSDSSAANFARGRICRYGGCLEARAQNFDPSADFDDGSCAVAAGVLGCTDSAAEDYDSLATIAGPCARGGCTDSLLPGYDSRATYADGSCAVAIWGCTRPDSINFQSFATSDDGTCVSMPADASGTRPAGAECRGAEDSAPARVQCGDRPGYDPRATFDDGSCGVAILGCLDSRAANYRSAATEGTSADCALRGCTHSRALNFDSRATVDDGGCAHPVRGCVDSDALNFDPGATVDAGSCYILGCPDSSSPAYTSRATVDDGSCVIPVRGCRDPAADNFQPQAADGGVPCVCVGCMDPLAANFDPRAAFASGACEYSSPPSPPPLLPSALVSDLSGHVAASAGCTSPRLCAISDLWARMPTSGPR